MAELRFLRVLQNKEFTYALFAQLADDFNGDTFPSKMRPIIFNKNISIDCAVSCKATHLHKKNYFFSHIGSM